MHRFEVLVPSDMTDPRGQALARRLQGECHVPVEGASVSKVYYVAGLPSDAAATHVTASLLSDGIAETVVANQFPDIAYDWAIEVGYKPGVTDNEGHIAAGTLRDAIDHGRIAADGPVEVHAARRYYLRGGLDRQQAQRIAEDVLANALVQRVAVIGKDDAAPLVPWSFVPTVPPLAQPYQVITLPDADDALLAISRQGLLSLNLAEMQAIRAHFADPARQGERLAAGLPVWPTDVELEVLAQTWSEHCKHKIFNDRIRYVDETGTETMIDGLFGTYIRGSTDRIATERDWLVSVFKDNAGVIRWTDSHHLAFKVETHNAPSALEPYGGALTGIVGVNRDPAGTGLGAKLIFNTDVFCFAPPTWDRPLPPGVLHPRRIFAGVRQGVEDGGNQSGVPTVNGGLFFDERYLGRPLVFCGTGALMPVETAGRPCHEKAVVAGDLIVMAGGRVGKDGIHGATFSSAETGADAPVGVVQIGDPITQKQLLDMLAEARELGLYRAITDNGAGGLSSSVGEMAEMSDGALLELDRVPLKYPGLAPWEILVSESQERMTLAVPPEQWPALAALAARRDVEVSVVGRFQDDGQFRAMWHGAPVMSLPMAFLHGGLPRRTLDAVWTPVETAAPMPPVTGDWNAVLLDLVGSLNICSRESVIRQYDHEVQGGSVVKPLVGVANDGPSDAAVLRPDLGRDEGVAVSCAINPHYGDHDAYAMATALVDEAVRNAVAVGADPDHLALLDNFCWPEPIHDPVGNPDGPFKLAQLVRACQGLYDATTAYGTPLISGKDSMKNDYRGPEGKISVPPTLLVSGIARHPDIRKAVTMDAKAPDDLVYVLGTTKAELGGSQVARLAGWTGGQVPQTDFESARKHYRALHRAMLDELVTACHDCSDGGLAVALAEMGFAGGLGITADLDCLVQTGPLDVVDRLYAESSGRLVVTVRAEDQAAFERVMAGCAMARIGTVTAEPTLRLVQGGKAVVTQDMATLKRAWQEGLTC